MEDSEMQISTSSRKSRAGPAYGNSYKKKNGFKGKRGKKTGYDGIYYAKINGTFDLLYNSTIGAGFFSVAWGNNGTSTAGFYQTMEDVGEFNGTMKLFKFWRINGLRIRILPAMFTGSTDRAIH